MNVYTDPRLLDVAVALDALPSLPLDSEFKTKQSALSATGTEDKRASKIAPVLAPDPYKSCKSLSSVVKMFAAEHRIENDHPIDISDYAVKSK